MKFVKLVVVMCFALLLITGCDEDSKNTLGTDFPTNLDDVGTVMVITPWEGWGREASVMIWTDTEPVTSSLEINGTVYDLEWEFYGVDWSTWVFIDGTSGCGDTFNYDLTINNNTISGSIDAPYLPEVDWPVFNFNENYAFEWTLEADAELQIIEFYLETIDDEIFEEWQISGSERAHEINKSKYQGYENTYDYLDIGIMPVNYKWHNGNNVFVLSHTYTGMTLNPYKSIDYKKLSKKILNNK